jgi:hypothetical protein
MVRPVGFEPTPYRLPERSVVKALGKAGAYTNSATAASDIIWGAARHIQTETLPACRINRVPFAAVGGGAP